MSIVLKKGTMKNYYTTEKYLYRFLAKNRKVNDVRLKQLNYAFVTDFEHFLRNYRDSKKRLLLGNNGVMKHLERFKKMLNLAVKLEWMDKNPFNQLAVFLHMFISLLIANLIKQYFLIFKVIGGVVNKALHYALDCRKAIAMLE